MFPVSLPESCKTSVPPSRRRYTLTQYPPGTGRDSFFCSLPRLRTRALSSVGLSVVGRTITGGCLETRLWETWRKGGLGPTFVLKSCYWRGKGAGRSVLRLRRSPVHLGRRVIPFPVLHDFFFCATTHKVLEEKVGALLPEKNQDTSTTLPFLFPSWPSHHGGTLKETYLLCFNFSVLKDEALTPHPWERGTQGIEVLLKYES